MEDEYEAYEVAEAYEWELQQKNEEIERLREALQQCVHVVQSEIEYCKDHTTAWFKLCVATREKALAALGEKESG